MPTRVQSLISDVLSARERFIAEVGDPSPEQAAFRCEESAWSITDNVEHMTMAERSGTNGLWKALDGKRRGVPVWSGDAVHAGRSVEDVVASTWQEREVVPPIAAPSWGGPVAYWITALRAGHVVLESLGRELELAEASGIPLDSVIYPHPISGPLDAWQRLHFLRFHLDRHSGQVARIKAHADFPRTA